LLAVSHFYDGRTEANCKIYKSEAHEDWRGFWQSHGLLKGGISHQSARYKAERKKRMEKRRKKLAQLKKMQEQASL